ncbi:hypothetical protein [Candidatus Competibacter phosphatis]|uniref:hypothetical protein n=1 Tax=Candidatus Competibacter phosphatis TaxID=221280 RepID=UPI001FE80D59|nr:hypothetical protein [Candidatus Competibacter phosphatis]
MKVLFARLAGPLIGLMLFAGALWVLHQALAEYRYQDVVAYLRHLPSSQLFAALLGTALSYLVTTGYDWLALRYVRRPLPWSKVASPPCSVMPSATRSDCRCSPPARCASACIRVGA